MAGEGHFAGRDLGAEVVDLDSPDLAVAAVHEILVHLCNPDLAALAILNDSVVGARLYPVVVGSEDHIADH